MTDYLALYRNYLTTEKRMSANTVSSYMRDLGQYQDWLQQKKTDIKKAKNTLLQEYIKRLEQLGKSPATTSRFLASSKSFYAYMLAKGYIKTNPSSSLKAKKVQKSYPEVLTSKEVELFLEQPKCVDEKGFRDHAMLELLYATAIRVSELISLDVEFAGRTHRVPQQRQGAEHSAVPRRRESSAGLCAAHSGADRHQRRGKGAVCEYEWRANDPSGVLEDHQALSGKG